MINKLHEAPKIVGRVTVIATNQKGEIVHKSTTRNLVMQGSLTGLDLVVQWLIGNMGTGGSSAGYAGGIGWGEIGTGTTTPALTDVGNAAGVARVIPSSQQDIQQTEAVIQFFFPDAYLPNQSYYEFATFVGGSATLGSGNIFNHALLGTVYVKGSGMDTTVQVTFTMSQ